ncbi:MAG: rhodanese-related sulfurtransferase [Oligoflexales bacterium]
MVQQDQDTVVSFYKFVKIQDPKELQTKLSELTKKLDMKGTIILAHEGVNAMVSGSYKNIQKFKKFLWADKHFADLEFKDSYYDKESFRRMLVKVKKYIITMRKEVDPLEETGEYITAEEFKKWQDEQTDMLIVDTRNDYEYQMGTFRNAIDPDIKSFDEFPDWVEKELGDQKEKTIVTFCTGGIRCEKATAYMKKIGFKKVYQLEGGIIKYLEKTMDQKDKNHWDGECIVFDKRKAIDKSLEPSQKNICYVCLEEIKEGDNAHSYPAGEACTSCESKMSHHHQKRFVRGIEQHKKNLAAREKFLASEREKYKEFIKPGKETPTVDASQ